MGKRMIDAHSELDTLRKRRQLSQRIRYHHSKLAPFRAELVNLRQAGATLAELVYWLQHSRYRKVSPSTVGRYLAKLPEVQAGQGVTYG